MQVQHFAWASRLRLCTKCFEQKYFIWFSFLFLIKLKIQISFTYCDNIHLFMTEDKRGYPQTLASLLPNAELKRQAGARKLCTKQRMILTFSIYKERKFILTQGSTQNGEKSIGAELAQTSEFG